ncbi:MAG: hypothetical protein FWE31_05240 [Firmicutes bacterium]|nr:hypothetical protein [Bacillota bacterium]
MRKQQKIDARKQLVAAVIADYDQRKLKRREQELQWRLNHDFYLGRQNNIITSFDTMMTVGKQFHWQRQDSFNHIAPIIEGRLARIASEFDQSDELREQATMWSEVCGTAFYKVVWNEGVQVSVHSPFEIYPDNLNAQDISEVSSLIHAKLMPVTAIKESWGTDLSQTGEESILVLERYERPSKQRQGGRLTIVAHEVLLHDGDLPFTTQLPFIRQTSESVVGSFFGKSVVERAIPVQRAYNTVKNRKVEFLNRMACGVLTVEEGSVDLQSLETDGLAPGKVIVYRHGTTPPQFLQTGTLPAELEREEDRLLREFETISGGGEISRSSTNTTATAMEILEVRDNRRMSRTIKSVKKAQDEIIEHIQKLAEEFGGN